MTRMRMLRKPCTNTACVFSHGMTLPRADAIVAAVSHHQFMSLSTEDLEKKLIKGGCFIDEGVDTAGLAASRDSGVAAVGVVGERRLGAP